MIVAWVQFETGGENRDDLRAVFRETADKYRKVPGLIRKYYLVSEDGGSAGGCYLFESKAAAEQLFTPEWRETVAQRYGSEPTLKFFEVPVVVDNLQGEIVQD